MKPVTKNLNWNAYFAEFFGTFVVCLVTLGTVLNNSVLGEIGTLGIAIAYGFSYCAMVFATVAISGGHLNPAVSLSLWFARKLSSVDTAFYIVAQFLAGFAAVGILIYIFGTLVDPTQSFVPIAASISLQKAVVVEAVATAVLIFTYFATMVDRRGPSSFGPLALGLVVVALVLFASPISGGLINPARALAPLLFSDSYSELAVWIIGPFTGSLVGLGFEQIFLKKSRIK